MSKRYYLNNEGEFVVEDYNRAFPFFNFLPAVAGEWGIPLWAFYVNRAQGIISFGIHDKNHSILEFYPADRALREVPFVGFRTFIKINGKKFYEPFSSGNAYSIKEKMVIKSESLRIEEVNRDLNLKFTVDYFTIPNMPFASLARVLKIKNLSSKKVELDVLDGLGRVIPFGSRDLFLKNLSRTLEAWMHSRIEGGMATFYLLVDPKDVAQTRLVEGANFNYAFFSDKTIKPFYIVDPYAVFGTDTSLRQPLRFLDKEFRPPQKQVLCGRTPCGLSFFKWKINAGKEETFYSLWGGVFNRSVLREVKKVTPSLLERKEKENTKIINDIKERAECVSSDGAFNGYIKNTYLDNILRGGYPYSHHRNKVYYIFSRKHGDLERDYNKFKIFASYFSEGEANYRDVNQNRRVDLFFNPFIEKATVVYFMNLLKIDGYNPLVVKGEKLYFDDTQAARRVLSTFKIKPHEELIKLMKDGFYLGEIFILMMEKGIKVKRRESFVDFLLTHAKREPKASFGDGYWIDHWRYNLDLIENFLYFYPDKLKELFFYTDFMFWDDEYRVRDRNERYFIRDGKVFQGGCLEAVEKKKELISQRRRLKNFLRNQHGRGSAYKVSLFTKLFTLVLNKVATLDPFGMGVEMEAEKPGWCDSLNGLPSLFGSSLCETMEVKRCCDIILKAIRIVGKDELVSFPVELYDFFRKMKKLLSSYFSYREKDREYLWWDKANEFKEAFRNSVFFGVKGEERKVTLKEIEEFIVSLSRRLEISIGRAKDRKSGLYFTYLFYEVANYKKDRKESIKPLSFKLRKLPLFLESSVHFLRLYPSHELVKNTRKSGLFDRKLKMYRLNMSLKNEPLEIGRSRVFPSGWLENESIWLHMEYKYLLELIKNGFYREFYKDFFNCVVCFLEPDRYGKNILENSSFIVSSAYPDRSLWGKGFVSRLTGATVELLNIWILMCMGRNPFFVDSKGELCLQFKPIIKKDLFTKTPSTIKINGKAIKLPQGTFSFKLFSSILVVYHNPQRKDTFCAKIKKIVIETPQKRFTLNSNVIPSPLSYAVRERKVKRIDIYLQ